MAYFFSHIGYILIAGIVIGLIGFASTWMAARNAERRTAEENAEREKHCQACTMASMCMNFGQESSCGEHMSNDIVR